MFLLLRYPFMRNNQQYSCIVFGTQATNIIMKSYYLVLFVFQQVELYSDEYKHQENKATK